MVLCETPDFQFPMNASLYFPIVDQNAYGQVSKKWVLDRIIACNFSPSITTNKQNIKSNVAVTEEILLIGRSKTDIRISGASDSRAITNIIITDIKDKNGNEIYKETSGPRAGKSTLFEIATIEPFINPFGVFEYYTVNIRRSENQAVEV